MIEELSTAVHASKAQQYGKDICLRLKETIPRQLYQVAIQAAVGGKIVARENVPAMRKDVTAKCVSIYSSLDMRCEIQTSLEINLRLFLFFCGL